MGPITSGQSLRRLINRCYMSEGNGKVTPQDIIGEKVEDALTKGNCRRAMGILSQKTLLDPDSQKGIRVTHELHPDPPRDYEPPTLEPSRNHDRLQRSPKKR